MTPILPDWVHDQLQKAKRISNVNPLQFQQDHNIYTIDLSLYYLLLVGGITANNYHLVRLVGNLSGIPLSGPHLVEYWQGDELKRVWVKSLTCLKQQVLSMTDHLSFERAAYLIMTDSESLIRLKCVRCLLAITVIASIEDRENVFDIPGGNTRKRICASMKRRAKKPNIESEEKQNNRLQSQLNNTVSLLCTAYMRKEQNPKEVVRHLQRFNSDIFKSVMQASQCVLQRNGVLIESKIQEVNEEPPYEVCYSPMEVIEPVDLEIEHEPELLNDYGNDDFIFSF